MSATSSSTFPLKELQKTPTGISGLDEVTGGGFPTGRSTLVCGPAGCGKTLLGMEFLVRGVLEFNEPGVFVAFEESVSDLTANFASLGFDLAKAESDGKLMIEHVNVIVGDVEETGDWDLDGLFLRLGAAIDSVGAKRIVIDTIEVLFGAFTNTAILRSEMHRLFEWLKTRGVTAVITGERGDGSLSRHGIEEYVSDCVIVLDHRVTDQTSTRRLRILKYRGSLHGTNEYPFLIGDSGVSVLPITSLGLQHTVSANRVSTGVARLDVMLGDGGFYEGALCWSAARPARVSRPWPHSSAPPRAPAASEPCTSPSRSPRRKSSGTCRPSGSICGNGLMPVFSSSAVPGPAFWAWRRTCSLCRSRSESSPLQLS
jgi:circadian clock protein KaiC